MDGVKQFYKYIIKKLSYSKYLWIKMKKDGYMEDFIKKYSFHTH